MRRRALLFLLGGGAAAWPLGGKAQEAKKPTLGVLSGGGASRWLEQIAPSFRQGLVEGGYSGGRTVTIEGRYAEGHFERLPTLAADLLNQQVALVATISLPAALAAKGGDH
jgi:putative ABC transport system substrate-binding protein